MGRKIKLCLVYRDMWQSSGKYMPRVDQLTRITEPIIDMGCFARVETNGGGFEQINLLYGENPNKSVRAWTAPLREAGLQTQMLERGLNGIRMSPVPKDVRELMFKVKKAQGTDIARSFDGLNDVQNLELSIAYAKKAGMISQGALCITYSQLHTVDYFIKMADDLVEMGAEEIAVKDMAGIGRPVSIGKMIAGIKKRHPNILVQYHGHATPGFSLASSLEAARAGADIIDVGMEPLSWGTGHADLLTVHAMLEDAGFELDPINMNAYMKARSLSQEFIDDFLGYYINPYNRRMNSLLIGPGLPGGMMGSLMADLEKNLNSLNKWFTKRGKPTITQDELLIHLFNEVEHIWPMMGYPPLVTPFSQYVKNVALMNVMQMLKGKERWSLIDDNTWDMLLGRSGRLPGELAPELVTLADKQGREFFKGNPQELYPNDLDTFRKEMQEKGWELGEDEEELMELAMHPQQYRSYKSGKAKADFEADLNKRKAAKEEPAAPQAAPAAAAGSNGYLPKSYHIDVNGEKFKVQVSYGETGDAKATDPPQQAAAPTAVSPPAQPSSNGSLRPLPAPLEGTFYHTKDPQGTLERLGKP
jgi:pyruvate carboxylase subunit B